MTTIVQFESWEDFRSKSEFFPAGRIVPKRIMDIRTANGRRFKFHHRFIFGVDTWLYRASDGTNILVGMGGRRSLGESECLLYLQDCRNHSYGPLNLRGAPYGKHNLLYNPIAPRHEIGNLNAYLRGDATARPIKAYNHVP